MFHVVTRAFALVLCAEIAGDKLLYNTAILSARFSLRAVALGLTAACSAKIAIAIVAARFLASMPHWLSAIVALAIFGVGAITLVRKPVQQEGRNVVVVFMTIAFFEIADPAQVVTATLAATTGHPWLVGFGAVCALLVKGGVALALGRKLGTWMRQRVSQRTLIVAQVVLLGVVAFSTTYEDLFTGAVR